MQGFKHQYRGFTLIELLVVISIIAILVSIMIPQLTAARWSARSSMNLSNLRQQGIAVNVYITEHNGDFPKHSSIKNKGADATLWQADNHIRNGGLRTSIKSQHGSHSWGHWDARTRYPDYLWQYMPDSQVWTSPNVSEVELPRMSKEFAWSQMMTNSNGKGGASNSDCPQGTSHPKYSADAEPVFFGGYGYNYQYLGNSRTGTNVIAGSSVANLTANPYHARLERIIRSPGSTIVIADIAGSRKGNASNEPGTGGEAVYSLDPPLASKKYGTGGNKRFSVGCYYPSGSSTLNATFGETSAHFGSGSNEVYGTWEYRSFLAQRNVGFTAAALMADGSAHNKKASDWDDFDGDGVADNGWYNGRADAFEHN